MNFVLPDDIKAGDVFELNWTVDHTGFNLGNGNDSTVTLDSFNGVDGKIVIESVEIGEFEEIEITEIKADVNLGMFFADNTNPFDISDDKDAEVYAIANITRESGITETIQIDITDYMSITETPHSVYWTAFNDGNAKFNFNVPLVYDSKYTGIAAEEISKWLKTNPSALTASAIVGQRGDATLTHDTDTADAALICFYERDEVAARFAQELGGEYVAPVISADNDVLAKFLSDVNEDDVIDTGDAALVCKFESAKVAVEFEATMSGTTVKPEEIVLLWNDILG